MITPARAITLTIDADRCHICSPCLARQVCKVRAIVYLDREDPPYIDMHRCYACMLCITECPFEAISSAT